MAEAQALAGPDLINEGVVAGDLGEGAMIVGHADDKPVVLVRTDGEVLAIGGRCTHYGGPLGKGYLGGGTVRCPWHHAAFDVRNGRAVRAPALNPVASYDVTEEGGRLFVSGPVEQEWTPEPIANPPESVLILGGGPAGQAAAETLRNEGYRGPVTMLSADEAGPVDRPNLSKDFLAGTAPEEWIPLRGESYYVENEIDLRTATRATSINLDEQTVSIRDGSKLDYGTLLIATGADPIHLDLPGSDRSNVHYLRTLGDSRSIIASTGGAQSAVVVGASFIGLEVAASLRNRELEVHVVAPEAVPMAALLGDELGHFIRSLHEEHGVEFHLGHTVTSIDQAGVLLNDGSSLAADLVVVGVGVRPATALAEQAGLEVADGIVVDDYLQTSAPGVFAAGDVARFPYQGSHIRVEHFVVAQRHGQAAARNIVGRAVAFTDVPFFWSQHYDVQINYVGHAEEWDHAIVDGSVADHDAKVSLRKGGITLAVATIYRDLESLEAEAAFEAIG